MDIIDHIFYINLDHRTDRRQDIEEQLKLYDIPMEKVTRSPGISHEYGFIGCTMAHLNVLKKGG